MRRAAHAGVLLAALVAAPACVPEEGPSMNPGEDCLGCHGGGDARPWTAAGTWSRGAAVTITDAAGKSFTIYGNAVGNFYTAESLVFPISVSVNGSTMSPNPTYGGCNAAGCHPGGGGDRGGGG